MGTRIVRKSRTETCFINRELLLADKKIAQSVGDEATVAGRKVQGFFKSDFARINLGANGVNSVRRIFCFRRSQYPWIKCDMELVKDYRRYKIDEIENDFYEGWDCLVLKSGKYCGTC